MIFFRKKKKPTLPKKHKTKVASRNKIKKATHKKDKKVVLPIIAKHITTTAKKFNKFDQDFYRELQTILVNADFSIDVILKLMNNLKIKQQKEATIQNLLPTIKHAMINFYGSYDNKASYFFDNKKQKGPLVVLMVGVNGAGKTTTLAKLGFQLKNQGHKILFVAADTFRSGAVDQLNHWSKQIQADIIMPTKPNQDPSSLIYQAMEKAQQKKYSVVLIDTAGRLQNKKNLMSQLKKMVNNIDRFLKNPIKERMTLLTIDAHIGRNGLQQAKIFAECTNVDGLILTKIDGSAKGGIIFSIKNDLKIPVYYQCFGEKLTDIKLFDINYYIDLIF